jgi:hypothetical protein
VCPSAGSSGYSTVYRRLTASLTISGTHTHTRTVPHRTGRGPARGLDRGETPKRVRSPAARRALPTWTSLVVFVVSRAARAAGAPVFLAISGPKSPVGTGAGPTKKISPRATKTCCYPCDAEHPRSFAARHRQPGDGETALLPSVDRHRSRRSTTRLRAAARALRRRIKTGHVAATSGVPSIAELQSSESDRRPRCGAHLS